MVPVVQIQVGSAFSRALAALALLSLALCFAPSLLFALLCPDRAVKVLNGLAALAREVVSPVAADTGAGNPDTEPTHLELCEPGP